MLFLIVFLWSLFSVSTYAILNNQEGVAVKSGEMPFVIIMCVFWPWALFINYIISPLAVNYRNKQYKREHIKFKAKYDAEFNSKKI